MRSKQLNILLTIIISTLFLLFQIVSPFFKSSTNEIPFNFTSSISRVYNLDASIASPFNLERLNKFWFYKGDLSIVNDGSILQLTNQARPDKSSILLSNGLGDNIINDFEIISTFSLLGTDGTPETPGSKPMGDGMVFFITPDNSFMTLKRDEDIDEYTKRTGILARDTTLMGIPKNLPGLAIVLDTHKNSLVNNNDDIPFIDLLVNVNPNKQEYDSESDGSKTTAVRLNSEHIKLNKSILFGQEFKLRIIYMESISFLKIDIQYGNKNNYWIELYQTHESIFIPKNMKTYQRFIGIAASTSDVTETVNLVSIQTNEFHYFNEEDERDPHSRFKKDMQLFLLKEFGDQIHLEMNDFKRQKMIESQPNYDIQLHLQNISKSRKSNSFSFSKFLLIITPIFIILYFGSVYIRVSMKHVSRVKHFSAKNGMLPM
ncbi:hypothetical protein TBLA_0D05580 [Henningerozyma blattae CBS 6284]|uniref:L-type lectin-like domain-containing protein n=1 Tax=Henningerozyma blattae (strain ATCC 34711 / CBS 6284 / DSM 70876 / NBRC 10599 / NRRL Y-10934 / UCD 77-7) TaxID=1071380 RepID=I2H3U8_HENB6|nr:hypothetical protein TBLA_0D05580 [Tetrapisispora blattae CBS 6284]CCH61050.1 hypothetical protein TBLA_0D05580 [Tetrapisispora blattae CBS 6284]